MKVVISSGHGKYVRGASGYLDEVDESRLVVNRVAELLEALDVDTTVFHDDISTTQEENLERIVDFHNSCTRDLDCSIHFNAFEETSKAMGTECWYVSQKDLAATVSAAIAEASGLPNRGAKQDGLNFLNNTEAPAILVEVVFVDSSADAVAYGDHFQAICGALAEAIAGQQQQPEVA